MENNKIELLVSSKNILERCQMTLTELSKTCCMPERSPNIDAAKLSIDNLISCTNNAVNNKDNANKCIDEIGQLGSKVGFLYATCCTDTREPLYQSIFKDLSVVHVNMWAVLGHGH